MAFDKVIDSVQLENDLRGVADSIRAKAGTTDELEFPEGFKNAVDNIPTGGGTEEIEQMIDESGVLDSTEGTATEKVEQLVELMETLIQASALQFGGNHSTIERVVLNCKNVRSLDHAFYNCNRLTEIHLSNTYNVSAWGSSFSGSNNIKTIETLDMSRADKDVIGGTGYKWISAPYLENLRFVPQTIKNSIIISWCPLLTAESIQSIAYGLAPVTTAQTLTLPKVFENDFVRLPAELRDLINAKGWTLAFG